MSKIKVYVRVRPPLPKEFDEPGCFNCLEMEDVSGNWLQVKKDGEARRYFARCWGPQSSQEECFRTVGVNTVNDVFEGYYGCIFVYGQTGTGKTFTLGCQVPGLEGIQPRCLKMAFDKMNKEAHKYDVLAKFQYVQLYRDSVQDLLNIAKDDLVVRVDEQTGATIEDVTTRECKTYEESLELIREGDSNRAVANTKMNSGSSRSHACLVMEIFRTNKETGEKTFGRLYLIDLAGSERVSKSGVTGDQYKEAVAINKSLTTLGNCISGLVNGEKIIAFRESKLTRLLQHSLSGHGRTSIVVTLRPDSPNMSETLCTLKFGERAQKVEAQMTPAGFRDQALEARDKALETERAIADNLNIATANKRWAADLMEVVRRRGDEIRALEASSEAEVQQHRRAAEAEKKRIRDALDAEKAALTDKHNAETKALRDANSSILAEVDRKIADAVRKAEERGAASLRPLQDSLDRARRECAKAKEGSAGISVSATDVADKVAVELARVTKEKEVLQRKIRGCRQTRFATLASVPDIEVKRDATAKLQRVLERKRTWLTEQMEEWDEDVGKKAFKKEKKTVDDIRSYALLEAGWSTPQESDAESSAPPSSEPPPTDSDMTDSDSDSDSDSSSGSSSSGSGSSGSGSSNDAGSDDEGERTDKVTMDWGAAGARRKDTFIKIVPPRKHLDNAMKRDKQLAELVEQIAEYLEFGSTCYIVNTKSPPASIHRRHLFLDKARKMLCAAEYKPPKEGGGPNVPDKETAREVMPLSEVGAIVLGQFSEGMLRALEGAPIVPHGTQMPETSAKITLSALPVFFYRSLTICSREKPIVDIVLDTDTDFEAWIVTLQRLTRKEPRWGGALELTLMKDVAKLTEEEKKLCQDCHIVPTVLLNAKDEILNRQQKVFYTLYDVRTVSGLDLLHAQWAFDFFMRQEYFERVQLNHARYLEMQAELTEENSAREAIRQLRVRIVNMHRHWVDSNASEGELHKLLRTSAGREMAVLDEMLQKFGREPTADEVKVLESGGGVAARPAMLKPGTPGSSPDVPASPLSLAKSSPQPAAAPAAAAAAADAPKHTDPTTSAPPPPAADSSSSSSSDDDAPPPGKSGSDSD